MHNDSLKKRGPIVRAGMVVLAVGAEDRHMRRSRQTFTGRGVVETIQTVDFDGVFDHI